jgi:hypothetical protein
VLNESIKYSGHSGLFRGDEEVGPVSCFAICEDTQKPGVFLLHCDLDWTIRGTVSYESIGEAREDIEDGYPGVSALWVDANVSETDAAKYLNDIWGAERCSFCGRDPRKMPAKGTVIIEKNGLRICYSCTKEFYDLMREDDAGARGPA